MHQHHPHNLVNEGAEAVKGSVESTWEYFDQIYVHHYSDATVQGNPPRIRYGTDARSTKSQLKTADALGIKHVGFWTWNSASAEMLDTLYNWTGTHAPPKFQDETQTGMSGF